MMPGTVLYVYLGSVGSDLTALFAGDIQSGDFGGWLFYLGLVATLVLTIVITRIATKTLNERLDEQGVEQADEQTDGEQQRTAGSA